LNKNNLQLIVSFDNLKYTKISQTPRTTLSALVSNLGGSTGLFLDLSFMSTCRVMSSSLELFLNVDVLFVKISFNSLLYIYISIKLNKLLKNYLKKFVHSFNH